MQIGLAALSLSGSQGGIPSLALNLLSATLDPRISASGGANGTVINVAGNIVSSSAPRWDYDPTTHAAKGLLIEEPRTNLFLNSVLAGTNLATQGVTVTAVATTVSFYGTGTITFSGAFVGSLVGSGAYPTRSKVTFTPSAGTLTCTVTGTVQFAQCEVGAIPTSFIPTAGATVTRTLDLLTMTGTNFSSWWNPLAGTLIAEGDFNFTGGVNFPSFCSVDDGTANNAIEWSMWDTSGQTMHYNGYVANVGQWGIVPGVAYVAGTVAKLAGTYAANDFQAAYGGALGTADNAGTVPTVNRLILGQNRNASFPMCGHLRKLTYYPSRLSNASLQSLST